jgi:hypothetical protein
MYLVRINVHSAGFVQAGTSINELPVNPMIGEFQVILVPDSARRPGNCARRDPFSNCSLSLPKSPNPDAPGVLNREAVGLSIGLTEVLLGTRLL